MQPLQLLVLGFCTGLSWFPAFAKEDEATAAAVDSARRVKHGANGNAASSNRPITRKPTKPNQPNLGKDPFEVHEDMLDQMEQDSAAMQRNLQLLVGLMGIDLEAAHPDSSQLEDRTIEDLVELVKADQTENIKVAEEVRASHGSPFRSPLPLPVL